MSVRVPCRTPTEPGPKRAACSPGLEAPPAGLDADHLDARVREELAEEADRVRPAPDARDEEVGQPAEGPPALDPRLPADDGMEVAHHRRERVRPEDRAEDVVRRRRRRDPVPHRLVDRVLERARAARHRHDGRAEELHPVDVEGLPFDVDGAHVDDALEAEERARGRRRDAVLPRSRLGDDARLAHPLREERLAEGVVDLVGARVEKVLPLEPEPRAAEGVREAPRLRERRRPPGVRLQEVVELGAEDGVAPRVLVGLRELVERRHERLGHEAPAERAEAPVGVGLRRAERRVRHGAPPARTRRSSKGPSLPATPRRRTRRRRRPGGRAARRRRRCRD